jgi:hypothetical protein
MFSTPGSASVSSGRVGPHIIGAVEVSTTGRPKTPATRANATTLAYLIRFEISNARDESGLMVDK